MKKNAISVFLSVVLFFTLTACSGTTEEDKTEVTKSRIPYDEFIAQLQTEYKDNKVNMKFEKLVENKKEYGKGTSNKTRQVSYAQTGTAEGITLEINADENKSISSVAVRVEREKENELNSYFDPILRSLKINKDRDTILNDIGFGIAITKQKDYYSSIKYEDGVEVSYKSFIGYKQKTITMRVYFSS